MPSLPSLHPRTRLGLWMLVALLFVTGLAYWDEERESAAALQEFAQEQSTLASGLGAIVSLYVSAGENADHHVVVPPPLLQAVKGVERPGEIVVLLRAPGSDVLSTSDGRTVQADALRAALDRNDASLRLSRPEAKALGLPERTAFAGLAGVDAGPLGRYGIAAVATARRERDRERRARFRLVLGVAVAAGLVLAFGGIALRNQRKELELARELAVSATQAAGDARLARATRAAVMGTFAMGIAHEVSTPLGVIVGRAEQLLGRVESDPRAAKSARVIVEQADRIKTLVRRFLDLARGGPPTFERADAASVARGAVALVEHRFEKVAVSLETDVPDAMPFIQCDRPLLEHALVNLLLDACEACNEGGCVKLEARHDEHHVTILVTDDGAGITKEEAARATEPFFTTKPEGQGTGLGLAIASEIVKSHRGTLTIEPRSPAGTDRGGTCARVALPISPGEARHAA